MAGKISPSLEIFTHFHVGSKADLVRQGCLLIAGTTVFLMAVGGMTRVMNAGLACPDWPLCYGSVLPSNMDGSIFWEWFHRVIATVVGAMTLGLTALSWGFRRELARWVPWAMSFALSLVVAQGVLGGLTVTEFLRFDIVTAHLGTATLFFATLLVIALTLAPPVRLQRSVGLVPWVALMAAITTYGQLLLGGLVASQWALHQCLDLAILCQVMHNHLWGVIPTLGMVGLVVGTTWRQADWGSPVVLAALTALGLVCAQIGLGLATYLLQLKFPLLTVAHLITGIGLFASLVATATLSFRAQVHLS